MLDALPKRAFFQFEFPLQHREPARLIDGDPHNWTARYLLPPLQSLEDEEPIADVYGAWHADGLAFAFDVPGRRSAFQCDPTNWWKGDGLRLCIDTRDARDVKRATRFCHFFYILPAGGGGDGQTPIVGQHKMSRAKEPAPDVDVSLIKTAVRKTRQGYGVEVVIPESCLAGWGPGHPQRIGFTYKVKDTERGAQHFAATDDLGWNVDPSTWATAVLVEKS